MTVSDQNRKLIEEARDTFNSRDADAWVALWNPDCEWHPFLTARVEGDPGYHGHNGMRAWFEDMDEMFSQIHGELNQFREIGERVLVLGRMTATARARGAEVDTEVGWVFEPRGDRLQRGWSYTSHDQALREAELAR